MLYINAPIAGGKSSLTRYLSDDLDSTAYYEEVDNMPMLDKFYSSGEESRLQLAFPLQIAFLNYRYGQLRKAITERNSVLDSSLLSDSLMAFNLHKRNEFPDVEYDLYVALLQNMQANVSGHPFTGYPDLIVYLDMPFDLMLEHIKKRGRDMEVIDEDKRAYYYGVWETYNHWAKSYSQSPVVTIDMTKYDFVENMEDRYKVLDIIESRMVELNLLTKKEFNLLKETRWARSLVNIDPSDEAEFNRYNVGINGSAIKHRVTETLLNRRNMLLSSLANKDLKNPESYAEICMNTGGLLEGV